MHVTRLADASAYDAKGHFAMAGLHLQGGNAGPTNGVTISLSYFLPGGGADRAASPTDKYYIILDGEVVITTDEGETRLGRMDSCHLAREESRAIINRSNAMATMLVVVIQ